VRPIRDDFQLQVQTEEVCQSVQPTAYEAEVVAKTKEESKEEEMIFFLHPIFVMTWAVLFTATSTVYCIDNDGGVWYGYAVLAVLCAVTALCIWVTAGGRMHDPD